MNTHRTEDTPAFDRDEIYSVTEIADAIRQNLESEFPSVQVSGEIANFKAHTSGHYYFTLRDNLNLLRTVMFRRNTYKLKIVPENGIQVIATGSISHYGGSGQTQLIVTSMVEAGRGRADLEMRVLLSRLVEEGLTDPARKRPIPGYPERIGVITSSSGAVIKDIRMTIARRWPLAEIVHLPCDVQGSQAAASIVSAFNDMEKIEDLDVVIVGRGGGSIEDLWAFNLEPVVRAIAACPFPVITGIGHETDTTVSDHVADVRAATPTAAAELATPSREEVSDRIAAALDSLSRIWKRSADNRLGLLEYLLRSSVFPSLRHNMESAEFSLSDRETRLGAWWRERSAKAEKSIADHRSRVEKATLALLSESVESVRGCRESLERNNPRVKIASYSGVVDRSETVMRGSIRSSMRLAEKTVSGMTRSLEGLHPLAILKRGYSYCRREDDGSFIDGISGVSIGDKVKVSFHDGDASCLVKNKKKEK